jgi:cellulose biosynthesis protein BcsQ
MAHKICVYNKKGGVGKTTISVNLAATIASKKDKKGNPKYRVLLVDCDPQGNASDQLEVGHYDRREDEILNNKHLGTVLKGGEVKDSLITYRMREYVNVNASGDDIFKNEKWVGIDDETNQQLFEPIAWRFHDVVNFQILPAYSEMEADSSPDSETYNQILKASGLPNQDDKLDEDVFRASLSISLMAEKLEPLESKYDFIIFDCPPAWDRFAKMAVYASDQIIIPLKPGEYDPLGVFRVFEQLDSFRSSYGRGPELVFAIMGMIRGNVKTHLAYHKKAFLEFEEAIGQGLVARTGIPLTEEVTKSQQDFVTFAFGGNKYKGMAQVFNDVLEELEARVEELKSSHSQEVANG